MTLQRVYGVCSAVCALLTIVCGYYAFTLPWGPRIDFDVLGFLWVLGSLPRLSAIALGAFFAAMALKCWVRARLV